MGRDPNASSSPTLADALDVAPQPGPEREAGRTLMLRASLVLVVVVLILLAWTVLAPLSGAVIAGGYVKTELNRKTVQHQEGGIVREILVREGQQVKAGEALVVIGDVRSDAALDLQRDQLASEATRMARLSAEVELAADFRPPVALVNDPHATEYLARERTLFAARRRALDEQIESLNAQMKDTDAQIEALSGQIVSTQRGAALAREELEINRGLAEQGFVQRTRLLALQRAVSDYDSQAAEQKSELALARQRLGDLKLRTVQARSQYQQQAAAELKETATRLREIEERLRPSQDQVERQYVRSPVDGEVMSIRVAAVGMAVGPREPILDVVPAAEKLVVEARIRPEDIDYVHKGSAAEVRLTAYEYRTMPMLPARVMAVSADRVQDPRTEMTWFNVLLEVDAESLDQYPGARMQAGMPAEVYVATPPRTLFEYMVRPLTAFARRGMREP